MPLTHMSGKDVTCRYRQNNTPVSFQARSIEVEENAEEVADPVCGEDRDRLQIITNFFTITIEAYAPDLAVLEAALEDIANNDAKAAPFNKVFGLRFQFLDGATKKAFVAREVARSPLRVSASGRRDRVMQTLRLRARYFEAAKAA